MAAAHMYETPKTGEARGATTMAADQHKTGKAKMASFARNSGLDDSHTGVEEVWGANETSYGKHKTMKTEGGADGRWSNGWISAAWCQWIVYIRQHRQWTGWAPDR